MSSPTNSSRSSNSSQGDLQLPNTPGFKKYIVVSKKSPRRRKHTVHAEIKPEASVDQLMEDIHQLHKEINDVTKAGSKVMIDCSNCFSCLRGINAKVDVDTKVKAEDLTISTI